MEKILDFGDPLIQLLELLHKLQKHVLVSELGVFGGLSWESGTPNLLVCRVGQRLVGQDEVHFLDQPEGLLVMTCPKRIDLR